MTHIHFGIDTLLRSHADEMSGLRVALVTNNAANAPGYGHFDRLIGRLDVRETLVQNAADPATHITKWTSATDWIGRVKSHLRYVTG